jgi:hypothetical protein
MRVSPGKDATEVANFMVKKLTENPPYGAKVTAKVANKGNGWC